MHKIEVSDLDMGPVVGKGQFGVVHRASWRGTPVAVKKISMMGSRKDEIEKEVAIHRYLICVARIVTCLIYIFKKFTVMCHIIIIIFNFYIALNTNVSKRFINILLPRSLDSVLARTHCVHNVHSLGSIPAGRYLTLTKIITPKMAESDSGNITIN